LVKATTDAAPDPVRGATYKNEEERLAALATLAGRTITTRTPAWQPDARTPAWQPDARTPAWRPDARTPAWNPSARNTSFTPAWAASSHNGGGDTPDLAAAATPQVPATTGWGGGFGDQTVPGLRGGVGGGYGGSYGAAGSTSVVQDSTTNGRTPAYSRGYPSAQSGATTPAYGHGYGSMSGAASVRSGAASGSVRSSAPTPAFSNGYGTASSAAPGTTPSTGASAQPMGPPSQRPVAPMGISAPGSSNNHTYGFDGAASPMGQVNAGASRAAASASPLPTSSYYATGGRKGDEFDDGNDSGWMPSPKTAGQKVDVYKTAGAKKAQGERSARQ